MIQVVIVSDIRLYCEGLAEIFNHNDQVRVVGIARDSDSAVREIQKSAPDVALIDMTMPDSCRAITITKDSCKNTKVIAIGVGVVDDKLITCAKAGITGYVSRDASIQDLVHAINDVVNGDLYCPPKITATLFAKFQALMDISNFNLYKNSLDSNTSHLSILTQREQEVAVLLASGMSNKQIARRLVIEISTVKNHVHSILVKMGVDSRTHAASLLQRENPTKKSVS